MRNYTKKPKEKLKGKAWENRRNECFERDAGECQYCDRNKTEYLSVSPHHRIFKSQSGDDLLDNLATICMLCHSHHGALKNKRLKTETDDTKINELIKRYQ